jgi:hypothetical protein
LDLASPSKRLPSYRTQPSEPKFIDCFRLSWDSFSCVPRRRHTFCASTSRRRCRHRSAQTLSSARVAFRRWFLSTSTVYSVQMLRVYCAPKPTGIHCISRCPPHPPPAETDRQWKQNTTPRNAVHTLRRIPLASSRTASPRPLPSCRSVHSPTARVPKHSFDRIVRQQAIRALAPPTTTPRCAEALQ